MIEEKVHYNILLQKQERSFTLTTPMGKEITTPAFTRALKTKKYTFIDRSRVLFNKIDIPLKKSGIMTR